MKSHRRYWYERCPKVLWAYQTTWHNTTRFSPYELVYGKNLVFPIEFEVKTSKISMEANLDLTEA